MKKKLFTDLLSDEIKEQLENECIDKYEQVYDRELTHEEIEQMENEHLEVSKSIHKVKAELDDVSAPLKAEKKKLEKRESYLIATIEKGTAEDERTVYVIPEYETQKVGIYDEKGILVDTRLMRENEKQYKIK
jgi:ABC-type phosphate transport system auxiliary subunit